MPATIIPEYLPFSKKGGDGEKKALEHLKSLPIGYFVIRECRIDSTAHKKARGSLEDRPDFVVVGPSIGVVILEVKDWNIRENFFDYLNDYEVRKTSFNGQSKERLKNPYYQANEYLYAVIGALTKNGRERNGLWVSSFVVYPKLSRVDFENKLIGVQKNNPQQRFIYDPKMTLFEEDLQDNPLKNIEAFVSHYAHMQQQMKPIYSSRASDLGSEATGTLRIACWWSS